MTQTTTTDIQAQADAFRGMIERNAKVTPVTTPAPEKADPLASTSPKQLKFIADLLVEVPADIRAKAGAWMAEQPGPLDRKQIHNLIERLKAHRPAVEFASVPEGHYALRIDDEVHFYLVERSTSGQITISAQASDQYHRLYGVSAAIALEQIDLDPKAALSLYGKELGVCGLCGITLTSKWRLVGIGPVCSQKL